MISWVILAAAITVMVRVANIEGRSPVFWGVATAVLCVACGKWIPWPYLNLVVGLVISYLLMFIMKIAGGD